jgi:hypothetical protein
MTREPPEICPNCGAEVPRNAKACPGCGSDDNTGWSEEASTGGLDLPDEDFNYQEFVKEEFGSRSPVPAGRHWFWWIVAVLILVAFVLLCVRW